MSKSTSPHPDEIAQVITYLTSTDVDVQKLAKEIALFAYGEERKKTDTIEQRAFGLMQFAKVGLTIIAGIAGLISNASIKDAPFRESLILILAVAGAYLAKLFYRGSRVVRVGTVFEPHGDYHVKPDQKDVFDTQSGANYMAVLKVHLASLVVYFNHTANDNLRRIYQCKCCYVNTFGFLVAFFVFFILSLMHLFEPDCTIILPQHRVIGSLLFVFALVTDWLIAMSGNAWLKRENPPVRY